MGLAQLARTPEVDDRRRLQYIEQICESADMLSAILSDILDLSKIEAGKLIVDRVAFDLRALIGTLKQAYGALADTKGLTLYVNIDDDVPQHVQGDPMRLRQVLTNYLTNALKFTTTGSILLNVQRGAGHRLRFEVIDTGCRYGRRRAGSMLFLPFSQVDNSITRKVGGTGLGLSICSELAKLMDGSVGVNSEPGKGSAFWVDLPLPAVTAQQLEEHESTSGLDALQGTRVLMVEDNPVNMMIAVALLERWGAIVDQASEGASRAARDRRGLGRGRSVRHRADGRPDARHERPRGHAAHAPALRPPYVAHRGADGGGAHLRTRGRDGRGHERLPHQADRCGSAAGRRWCMC